MFKNIKNFIRQGKQAHELAVDVPFDASEFQVDSKMMEQVHAESLSDNSNETIIQDKKKNYYNYNDLASELVKEELKLQKNNSNQYKGLEHYKIIDKLGEGAFSIVVKALNLLTNELVAIKIIKKLQLDNNQKKSVLKEATIMRQLNHDNIVKFIEFKEVEEFYYIIQELVPGGEIFNEIVKFTYFSEDLARHVIKQVGLSIRYLHEEIGVVHRDIKPENLLFQPIPIIPSKQRKLRKSDDPNSKVDEGEFLNGVGGGGIGLVKLADFGLSKQIWFDETKTPCGTVGYTAPEIVKDEHYSKEVDMWAIGCVLYTLLCGFPPFYDEKIDVLTEKVARGDYKFLQPWWDEISSGAKNCVKNLLTVDPNKRYTIDEFLNDPWLNKVEFKRPKKTIYSNFKRTEPVYSPAARAMKDAFDISNAVHRIGEEKLLNDKKFQKNKLNTEQIMEEEEDEIMDAGSPKHGDLETRSGRYIQQVDLSNNKNQDQQQQQHRRHHNHHNHIEESSNPFELSLDTSTIINRRKNKLTS
ncbi:hypothetical protein WICANDRAFT_95203 [Wickerhamomyces anomalus NRRL Y-366-8]|uniref:Protein kinase domain-containing protein n=1 Tax=Wickerhamomyces anomalus (strain ATCC 58044 / CBS 1984 / NCYC 433 / NRRL Y-366-8) TaxID=683960 RepID=A0A1E3NY34_WICAA|nr:uncharacterized protein WICANDRAFT_95203 [Wickerhamomyces anomalus NRRL Y-366-8]ODQ58003.1 hypothetical protein WICANDRAFT_95203 [Wickerhamomyces anomalus NRRL Y-366-8]